MRIGIHKLGFESINSINDIDKNGMFAEVKALISIFSKHDYNVGYVNTVTVDNYYDIIYVFNGFENRTSCLKNLKSICNELNYILTDSRFYKINYENEELFVDNYFVQSPVKMYDKPTYNSRLYKLPLYQRMYIGKMDNKKKDRVIFGGSVREREQEIFEYIIKPKVDFFLNSKELGIDTRIPLHEYRKLLNDYKYGIVIINPKDVEIGNITWRFYEYIIENVCTFVEINSDKNNLLLQEGDYRYVSSYAEMLSKMDELNHNKELYDLIISDQNSRILWSDITGKTFINSLLEKRQENV